MPTTTPFINEFHYDDAGADSGEFIEIAAAAGTDLTGYSIVLYNGSGGAPYATIALSGIVPDLQNGRGVLNFPRPVDGIQNGSPDGIALVGPGGVVLEFISYEGVMTAVGGPANGMISTNIGVSETGLADGTSIARIGTGENAGDFTWGLSSDDTPGIVNAGQTFSGGVTAPTFSVGDATVIEGDSGTRTLTFTITRSSGTGAATVAYATADGTAAAGSDYSAATGTVSFADGETSRIVTVTVNGDTTLEADETLTLTLSNPTGGTLADGVATGTITNDDIAASTVSVADAVVAEGNVGTTSLTFTITRSNGTGTATVAYATADGMATAGVDYTAVAGTVTFAEGVTTQTVTIIVTGDTTFEPAEALTLTLSGATGTTIADGVATGTITNDDTAPVVAPPFINEFHYDNAGTDAGEFIEIAGTAGASLSGYSLVLYNGNGGTVINTLNLSGVFPNQQNGQGVLSFAYAGIIQNGSPDGIALVGPGGVVLEFISYEGVLTATAGPAAGMTSIDVGVEEPGNANGTSIARVGTGGTAGNFEWVLTTDDTPGAVNGGQTFTPTVSVGDATVIEGDAGTTVLRFQVTRSSGAGTASVNYATADGAVVGGRGANSADYQAISGTVTFAAGETSRIVEVVVTGDIRAELDEQLTLNLTGASPGLTIADGQGTGTIVNDDAVPATVSIGDVRVTEGDNGETLATFTVTRAGGSAAFSVDFATADGTATAGSDYVATTGTLNFAAGETSRTITVVVNGDASAEPLETFTVNLGGTTGDAVIVDGEGVGTIVNDDLTRIFELQGEGHISPFMGEIILTEGVVTAIDSNGFYIQDATGDGNTRTSDAIFVFTGTVPLGIAIGDLVRVQGEVEEFQAGGSGSSNLSVTQISGDAVELDYDVVGTGTVVATGIGAGAGDRSPPTRTIDNDGLTSYDPETDGIDFFESLEGMLVTVRDARAVTSTDAGGTYVVASNGEGATGSNDRGGITLGEDDGDADLEDDFNPETILIYDDSTVSGGYTPGHSTGDRLGDVTGVVSYFGGEYEVVVTGPVTVVSDVTLVGEVTTLVQGDTAETGTADQLTVATYNVENLDPGDGTRIVALAEDIVINLGTPDIISLVEVQDADGSGRGADLSGQASAQALIDAIFQQSGVRYQYVEVAPTVAGSTGGEPGGNIRNGFLFNPARADYVDGSAVSVTGAAFEGSRRPLSAQFEFNGETVTLVSVHSTSRGGSDPLFGNVQPPRNEGDAARLAQSQAINAYIDALQAADPDADVIVLGDLNAFQFEDSVELFEGGERGLTNLYDLLAPEDRYSYVFGANSQALDHILVSRSLVDGAAFDAVHINTGVPGSQQASDHDALLTQLLVVGSGNNRVVGSLGSDVLRGFAGDDVYTVNANGDMVIEAAGEGTDTVLASINHTLASNVENLTLTGSAISGSGNGLDNLIIGNGLSNILMGLGGNDVLDGGAGADTMTGGLGDDVYFVDNVGDRTVEANGAGNDEIRTTLSTFTLASNFENLTGIGTAGQILNGNNGDNLVIGGIGGDTIDGHNGNDTLRGGGGDDFLYGGNSDDFLYGDAGADSLSGGNGGDSLYGGAGSDRLDGGNGNDVLVGGAGDDILTGGNGSDVFIIGPSSGMDQITDFGGGDRIDWSAMTKAGYEATITQSGFNTVIAFGDGSSVRLNGVTASSLRGEWFNAGLTSETANDVPGKTSDQPQTLVPGDDPMVLAPGPQILIPADDSFNKVQTFDGPQTIPGAVVYDPADIVIDFKAADDTFVLPPQDGLGPLVLPAVVDFDLSMVGGLSMRPPIGDTMLTLPLDDGSAPADVAPLYRPEPDDGWMMV